MKKTFLVTLGMIALIVTSLSFTRDEPKFKNLKILPKNITKEQMDSVMHTISLSLGVRCNFCHKHSDDFKTWDFASDENKHKLRAREMMKMTQKLNNKYFAVAGTKGLNATLLVTCYTCHHGSTDLAVRAPRKEVMPSPLRPLSDTTRRSQ